MQTRATKVLLGLVTSLLFFCFSCTVPRVSRSQLNHQAFERAFDSYWDVFVASEIEDDEKVLEARRGSIQLSSFLPRLRFLLEIENRCKIENAQLLALFESVNCGHGCGTSGFAVTAAANKFRIYSWHSRHPDKNFETPAEESFEEYPLTFEEFGSVPIVESSFDKAILRRLGCMHCPIEFVTVVNPRCGVVESCCIYGNVIIDEDPSEPVSRLNSPEELQKERRLLGEVSSLMGQIRKFGRD